MYTYIDVARQHRAKEAMCIKVLGERVGVTRASAT